MVVEKKYTPYTHRETIGYEDSVTFPQRFSFSFDGFAFGSFRILWTAAFTNASLMQLAFTAVGGGDVVVMVASLSRSISSSMSAMGTQSNPCPESDRLLGALPKRSIDFFS